MSSLLKMLMAGLVLVSSWRIQPMRDYQTIKALAESLNYSVTDSE